VKKNKAGGRSGAVKKELRSWSYSHESSQLWS